MAVGGDIVGQRLVDIELAEVDVGHLAEVREALLDVGLGHALALLLALQRLFHRLAQDRIDQEENLAVARIAALGDHVLVHVASIGAHGVDALGVDYDRVGMGRGKAPSARRAAGLGDHGLALRAGTRVEGATRLEVFALVIDGMDLGVIDQAAALAVGDDGARFP